MPYFAASDQCKIYYEENGTGRNVIFIHGCNCNHHFFKRQLKEFSKKYHVMTYDIRKHGLSEHTENNTSIEQCALDLKDLMEYLNIKDAVMIGHSFGAYVVFEYIRQFGCENIYKFVIDDMTARMINDENWKFGTFENYDAAISYMRVQAGDFQAFIKDATETMYGPGENDQKDLDWCYEQLDMNGSVLPFNVACITADYTDVLPLIKVPTLMTFGTRPSFYTEEVIRGVAGYIEDVDVKGFEGGHLHNYQDAENWNREVMAFIDK